MNVVRATKPAPRKIAPQGAQYLDRILFTANEQQAFLEDFATLVDDGVAPAKAIEVIGQLSSGSTKKLTDAISQKISEGKPLADGMEGWLPQHIVELVRAGESGGTLVQNLKMAGESLGRKGALVSSFASSLTYPVVVLIVGLGVMVYINNSVMKQFATIKPISTWPSNGQQLVAIANFVQSWWWSVLVAMIIIAVLLNRLLTSYTGPGRATLDNLPILSIYRQSVAARFMESMGLLISNGIVFKLALTILLQQANPYLAGHILQMERRLGRGRTNIAEVLDTGLISESDILRLRAIAEAKGFEHALVRLGRQSSARTLKTMQTFSKFLGGLLLALGGGLAMMMVFGIYSVGSSLA